MSRQGILNWFKFKSKTPQQLVSSVFILAVVVVVVSYGIWQLDRIISPSQIFSNNPLVSLSVSDYYEDASFNPVPLPNNTTDTTNPVYGDAVVPLSFNGQQLDMARLQGTIDYR